MESLFKKLNFKDHKNVLIANAPEEFAEAKAFLSNKGVDVNLDIDKRENFDFVIVFATKLIEIDHFSKIICPKLEGDAILWMCYPKGTSKKYSCDFNRDIGWASLGEFNMETVRMVAIDENWSAMRFRKIEYIKVINRKFDLLSKNIPPKK